MSLAYPTQQTFVALGTKTGDTLNEIQLESTYQTESGQTKPTKSFSTGGFSKLNIDLSYTMGGSETSNSIEVKFEGSPDGVNYYQLPADTTSGGTSTISAREFTYVGADGANAKIGISLDIFYEYMRVSVKETGVSSNKGTIYGEVTLSGQ
jgi:hypothetical protein